MTWICPVCTATLTQIGRCLSCANNHSFDLAKEGYTNLLLVNQKNSKAPGDSKLMLSARRDFLQAGYYQPLADKIIEMLRPYLLGSDSYFLDCGCGEGYYSEQIYRALMPNIRGIDIARDGVRLAAKRFKSLLLADAANAQFAVASSFNLPLPEHQLDAILQVFAPVSESELRRVLKSDGVYCDVSPGPKHFTQLKQQIYREAREHEMPVLASGFTLLSEERVSFEIELKHNIDLQNLLMMTPLYWKGSVTAKTRLMAMDSFTLSIDFVLRLYCPNIIDNTFNCGIDSALDCATETVSI